MFYAFSNSLVKKLYNEKSVAHQTELANNLELLLETETGEGVPAIFPKTEFQFSDLPYGDLDKQVLNLAKILRYLGNVNYRKYNAEVLINERSSWTVTSKSTFGNFLKMLVDGHNLRDLKFIGYVLYPKNVDINYFDSRSLLRLSNYTWVSGGSVLVNYLKEFYPSHRLQGDNLQEFARRIIGDSYLKGMYESDVEYAIPLFESMFNCFDLTSYVSRTSANKINENLLAVFELSAEGRSLSNTKKIGELLHNHSLTEAFAKTVEDLGVLEANVPASGVVRVHYSFRKQQ